MNFSEAERMCAENHMNRAKKALECSETPRVQGKGHEPLETSENAVKTYELRVKSL
ncbi:hypothetical protein EV213_104185 [Aureibacillus halotolerans]|uniref:Uncharacterized protein n=1 Tax=Aureibacillus halotolerans TaxID=1508390 RepID=A0A4V3D5S5_9BACI|nr:hypothetical protein EV213_104185 [Aureibacillus halotolerans]